MARTLQLYEQMQQDPEFQSLPPADKEWVTRNFLAKHSKDPDMQDPAYRTQVISKVRGIGSSPQVDAVTNPFEAFGRSFTNEAANNTLTGHALRAGAKATGATDGSEFFGDDFYTDNPLSSAAAFGGRFAAQVADPTNLIPLGTGVKAAGQVGRAAAGMTMREAVPQALRAAIPGAKTGAMAGAGFSVADGGAQRYLADENVFSPSAVIGDAARGAALGGALGGAIPAARAMPGREYNIPGFAPPTQYQQQQRMMQDAGLSPQDLRVVNTGEFPTQAAQPPQQPQMDYTPPPAFEAPNYQQAQPEMPLQSFTPEAAPQAVPQAPQYVMVTARGRVPVQVIGRSQDGRLMVDDGVTRTTIAEHLLEPAGMDQGAIVPRFGLDEPISREQRYGQIDEVSAQYPGAMSGMAFDGDANAAAFLPEGYQARPNPNPGDNFWGSPPTQGMERQRVAGVRDQFQQAGPLQQVGEPPAMQPDNWTPPYQGQAPETRNILPPALEQRLRGASQPEANVFDPANLPQQNAPQRPLWQANRGEGMQLRDQQQAPPAAATPEPPPRDVPIRVVNTEQTPGVAATEVPPATPVAAVKTGPLDAAERELRKDLTKTNSFGGLSDAQKQQLHSLNERLKANRPDGEVPQSREATKSPEAAEVPAYANQSATRQVEAEGPSVGASEGVGAMAANPELTARDFVFNEMEGVGATPSGEKMAGNVNISNVSTIEEVQAMTEAMANRHQMQMNEAKRGYRSHEQETKDAAEMLATKLGMSPEKLLDRQKGETYNAAQLKAAADIVTTSYEHNVKPAFARIKGGDNSDAAKLAAAKAVELHVAFMSNAYGARSEVGRALNAAKLIGDVNTKTAAQVKELLDQLGGGDKYEDIANILGDLDEADVARVLRNVNEPTWADMVSEYFINNILSGPPTQIANNVGNGLNVAGKLAETATAALVGGVSEKLTGRRATVTRGELREQFFSMTQGMVEGAKLAAHSAKTGNSGFSQERGIVGEGSANVEARKAIPGVAGEVLRLPSRLLTVGDDFWKGIVYRMELNGLAYRTASADGTLKGAELSAEVARLINEPTPEMTAAATQDARYRTFTDTMDKSGLMGIEKIGSGLMRIKAGTSKQQLEMAASPNTATRIAGSVLNGTSNVALNMVIPFVRTPVKIVGYAVERSPLAVALPEFWAAFGAGGSEREMALSKLSVGSAMAAIFYTMAEQGILEIGLTGNGPSDWREAKKQRELGFQPNSLTINGHSFSLQKFGNIGMLASIAADMAQAVKSNATAEEQQSLVGAFLGSAWKNFGEQTFWQGINEFMEMASDPDKNLNKFVAGRAAGLVPFSSALGRGAMATDNVLRETDDKDLMTQVANTVKSRLPGVSQTLPAKLDLLGNEQTRDMEGIEAFLSPSKRTDKKDQPVLAEFSRLGMNVAGPSKKITPFRKHPVELTPEEFRRYRELYGEELEERITRTIKGESYQAKDDDWKKTRLNRLIDSIGDRARNRLLKELPDIRQRARNEVKNGGTEQDGT